MSNQQDFLLAETCWQYNLITTMVLEWILCLQINLELNNQICTRFGYHIPLKLCSFLYIFSVYFFSNGCFNKICYTNAFVNCQDLGTLPQSKVYIYSSRFSFHTIGIMICQYISYLHELFFILTNLSQSRLSFNCTFQINLWTDSLTTLLGPNYLTPLIVQTRS